MAIHRFWARLSQGRPWHGCGKPYSGNFQTSKNRPYLKSGVFSFLMAVGLMGVCGVMIFVFPGKADSTSSLEPDEFSPRQGAIDLQLISRAAPDLLCESGAGKSLLTASTSGSTVSQDGRFLVFVSEAYNLIENQINSRLGKAYDAGKEVYLYDRVTQTNLLVSHTAELWNVTANSGSYEPVISADGKFVAFSSGATDLIAGFSYQNESSDPRQNVYLYERETGITTLVNHLPGSPTIASGRSSGSPALSADGRFVVFTAGSIYVYDRVTDTTKLVSHRWDSFDTPTAGSCDSPAISADGRVIAFVSTGRDFAADQNTHPWERNMFLYDQETGHIEFVSRQTSQPHEHFIMPSTAPILNADGSYLLFSSIAWDLAAVEYHDHNNGSTEDDEWWGSDVFLYERKTGRMLLVSHQNSSLTDTANEESFGKGISADGRFVVFSSYASDLVDGQNDRPRADFREDEDVFLFDRETQTSVIVSHNPSSPLTTGDYRSYNPVISADGNWVAFTSLATNLIVHQVDTSFAFPDGDLFLFHRLDGMITLMSHSFDSRTMAASNNSQTGLPEYVLAISAQGESVYYATLAFNLEATRADSNSTWDLYLFSQAEETNQLVSYRAPDQPGVTPDNASSIGSEYWGDGSPSALSANGEVVVFTSVANNLVPGQVDANRGFYDQADVFLYDQISGTTSLISHKSDSPHTTGVRRSLLPVVSGDGRYVVYLSGANDLVAGHRDGNGTVLDVFLYDRATQSTHLVSHTYNSLITSGNSDRGTQELYQAPSMSQDGRYIVFASTANNLVEGYKNPNWGYEVFLYDRETKAIKLVSHLDGYPLQAGLGNAVDAAISADGRFITFASRSLGLIKGQKPGVSTVVNLFVYDRVKDITRMVSHVSDSVRTGGNRDSRFPSMSADGRYITYISQATNLIAWQIDKNKKIFDGYDVFVYDQETRTNQLVSHAEVSPITTGDGDSFFPQVSANGQYIVFRSRASNLVKDQIDTMRFSHDLFLYDQQTGKNHLISRKYGTKNIAGNGASFGPTISGDGKRIVFQSSASNLVPNQPAIPGRSSDNVFLFDTETKTTSLISSPRIVPGRRTYDGASWPVISQMGNYMVFSSGHADLTHNDFNFANDVFLVTLPRNAE